MNPKPNSIFSFIGRYWVLLVLFAASLALDCSNFAFGIFGALLNLPVLVFGAVVVTVFVRHVFFRKTLDEDIHNGLFVNTWVKSMSARERVYINLAVTCTLFIGICLIAAALIR